ncbi:small integral membrane protein 30-like [Vombatus ursinus]|uniref:small integral membrane protein 30-like n=1 Tax=Vombatus ursinus TaxID=29139 RepID=UPI000FFD1510|nr:small integral membrane protein 30-like [Vombatus ursinus]
MASISGISNVFLALLSLLHVGPIVEVAEAGNGIALLLDMFLSLTDICAYLGIYARKRNGQM